MAKYRQLRYTIKKYSNRKKILVFITSINSSIITTIIVKKNKSCQIRPYLLSLK